MKVFLLIAFAFFKISNSDSNYERLLSGIKDDNKDSCNLYQEKNEILFKKWLKDTVTILQKDSSFKTTEIGIKSRNIIVYEDSLSFEIHYIIKQIINPSTKYSKKSIIGSTIYNLRSEKVILPKIPYKMRIAYTERYDLSFTNLIHEDSYEYNYLSTIPVNSNIETCYTLIKGNLTQTLKQKKVVDWDPWKK